MSDQDACDEKNRLVARRQVEALEAAEVFDRIKRACIVLGVEPPKELFRSFCIEIKRHSTLESGMRWHIYWSAPANGKTAVILLEEPSESAAADSPESELLSTSADE